MTETSQTIHARCDPFVAMLAHELRSPIATIRNAVTASALGASSPRLQAQTREMIGRQVEHLSRLVDDLLDASCLDRGKVALRKQPVRLDEVVALSVECTRAVIEARRQQFSVSLTAGTLWLDGDRSRLAQVLINLLDNAAKYTPQGGHIGLTVRRYADSVVITVRDDGIGIDPQSLPAIFDLFGQADADRADARGSMGIGLYLVKRFTEMHGGEVRAASAGPGTGTEFTIKLPLLDRTAPGHADD